jgi:signal transduction histidine kinase/phage shock protein PspC (stress-responsive transcriptional regulator)
VTDQPHRSRHARRAQWRPVRSSSDRVIAGVAGGLAGQLGVDAVVVRLGFVVLAFAGGAGVVIYLLCWLLAVEAPPAPPGEQRAAVPQGQERRERRSEPGRIVAVAMVVTGALLILRDLGVWFGDGFVWPVAVAALGSAVIWTRTDGPGRERLARVTSKLPRDAIEGAGAGWAPKARLVVGALLVTAGMAGLLVANDALAAARVARGAVFAVLVTVAGLALILGPWVFRLARQVSEERRDRIRSEERAEMAAHLHDSVLQTLAMIQRSTSTQEMRSLAHGQERELRTWLYRRTAAEMDANGARLLSAALDGLATRVERSLHVPVETVMVGDAPMDDRARALVEAAHEAISNAARHSGARSVAVYCEVRPQAIDLYVRDEGRGFDPSRVPPDRRGIAESIVGRMERGGGVATVVSEPTEGTEVHLRMPRRGG